MQTVKRNRREHAIVLRDEVAGNQAWGTEFGAAIFGRMNSQLMSLSEGILVPIDYRQLERSDVSFQREAVVETLRKHRPRLLFVAVNLTDPDMRENLSLALERRGDWLLVRDDQVRPTVLGKRLTTEQQATMERVWAAGELMSSGLADVNLSTASSRLSWLWKAGLVERVEGTSPSGGREHRYYPIV